MPPPTRTPGRGRPITTPSATTTPPSRRVPTTWSSRSNTSSSRASHCSATSWGTASRCGPSPRCVPSTRTGIGMKGLSNQRGQALILVALGGAFLFGLVALALDGGIAESDRRFLQSVGDGAALAGAQRLGPSPTVLQQQEARQVAVLSASSTLSGVKTNPSLPAGCTGLAFEFGGHTNDPGTALCDPDSAHSLYVETPYCPPGGTCRNDQVLVRLSHVNRSNFAGLMGIGQISIASRSVAQVLVGGSSLGYALYVAEELQLNGSSQHSTGHLNVGGNLYVGGCITGTNNIDIHVYPTPNGQVGKVEVYYGDVAGLPATSFQPKQIWNAGIGQGARCQAQLFTGPNTSANPNLPASFAAAGHLPNRA